MNGVKNFVEYFKTLAGKRKASKRKASNHDNWVSTYNYLETFTKGNLKFADLNEMFCNYNKNRIEASSLPICCTPFKILWV
jgi:hypothetical protein